MIAADSTHGNGCGPTFVPAVAIVVRAASVESAGGAARRGPGRLIGWRPSWSRPGRRRSAGRIVDGQDGPRAGAVLAAQLDIEAGAVVLDAKAVRLVAVLMQNSSAVGIRHE